MTIGPGGSNKVASLYQALATPNETNSAQVKVGSFRGARVTLVLNGETTKMSLNKLSKIVNNTTSGLNHTNKAAAQELTQGLNKLKAAAEKNPATRQKLQKRVTNAFNTFKESITGSASKVIDQVQPRVSETIQRLKEAIPNAPSKVKEKLADAASTVKEKLEDAKTVVMNQERLRSLGVASGEPKLFSDDPKVVEQGFKEFANRLLLSRDADLKSLEKMQAVLNTGKFPELNTEKNLIDLKIDLMKMSAEELSTKGRLRAGVSDKKLAEFEDKVDLEGLKELRDRLAVYCSLSQDATLIAKLKEINEGIAKIPEGSNFLD